MGTEVLSRAPRWAPIVSAENKQDKLGTSVTLPIQSAISSVGLFLVGTCLFGPKRGLPAEGTLKLKSAKALKKSNQVINGVMNAYL